MCKNIGRGSTHGLYSPYNQGKSEQPFLIILGETMKTNTKILIYLIVFAIFDMIIPIPFTATLLIYVLLARPQWFKDLVTEIYGF